MITAAQMDANIAGNMDGFLRGDCWKMDSLRVRVANKLPSCIITMVTK